MSPITILIIDDHTLFRSGLSMVLRSGITNVQLLEAGSIEEMMYGTMNAPDVLLLDIQLHGLNGLECIGILKRKWPQVPIVMLSSDASPQTRRQALERGAVAFISKAETPDRMLEILSQVLSNNHIAPALAGSVNTSPTQPQLTTRQCEVLDLLCRGLPNKVIGRRLGLSENTVRGHVQAVLAALQVTSRSEAVYAAHRSGLVN
jgi:DNA-binding NarL/FixJ family response regulator